jgi:ATP/ADP translocase
VVWVILSLIGVMFGVSDMLTGGPTFASGEAVLFEGITGMTWDKLQLAEPGAARFVDYQVRSAGGTILLGGLLTITITVLGLRRGQRWAWLTMWLVGPLSIVLSLIVLLSTEKVPGAGVPVPLIGQTIILIITVGLLLLTYRKYNPSR